MTFWFFDTAGIGSIIVIGVGLSVLMAYIRMMRWIQTTPPEPTPLPEAGGEQA
jgi:hypothetical protein